MKRLMARKLSLAELTRTGAHIGYSFLSLVRHLPADARSIVRKVRRGQLTFQFRHSGLESFAREVDHASNRLSFSVVIAAIIIGSSTIMGSNVGPTWRALDVVGLGEVPILGFVGFLLAGVMGLGLAWSIMRSGTLTSGRR
jgi:ubiquinone biosynthesis protein